MEEDRELETQEEAETPQTPQEFVGIIKHKDGTLQVYMSPLVESVFRNLLQVHNRVGIMFPYLHPECALLVDEETDINGTADDA